MKKTTFLTAAALCSVASAVPAHAATYTYVGSWHVGDGPVWTSNPAVLNGLEAAALLFGGNASDYAISTIDSNVANINFMTFVDGWGDSQYLYTPVAQTYKLDSGGPGYNNPYGGPAYSAYVLDHSCGNRYSDPQATCGNDQPGLNFAFRILDREGAVPEPGTWAMMIAGFGLVGATMRRRSAKLRFAF